MTLSKTKDLFILVMTLASLLSYHGYTCADSQEDNAIKDTVADVGLSFESNIVDIGHEHKVDPPDKHVNISSVNEELELVKSQDEFERDKGENMNCSSTHGGQKHLKVEFSSSVIENGM